MKVLMEDYYQTISRSKRNTQLPMEGPVILLNLILLGTRRLQEGIMEWRNLITESSHFHQILEIKMIL